MTYKLESWIRKINAPITAVLPDGKIRRYINGGAAKNDVFDMRYVVSIISAIDGEIILKLEEVNPTAAGWIGEESQGFF